MNGEQRGALDSMTDVDQREEEEGQSMPDQDEENKNGLDDLVDREKQPVEGGNCACEINVHGACRSIGWPASEVDDGLQDAYD